MLSLRLKPTGKKHQRGFRLVVDERRHKLQGKNIEDLGWYSPRTNTQELKTDRVLYWISKGAQASDTVHNLLVKIGALKSKKRPVHARAKKSETASAEAGKPATEPKESSGGVSASVVAAPTK